MLIKDSEEEARKNLGKFSRKRAGREVIKGEINAINAARDSLKCVQVGLTVQGKTIELCRYKFRIFDVDQSGGIDDEELSGLCNILCVPLTEAENLVLINSMDADYSGVVNFREFITWYLEEGLRRKWRTGGGWWLMWRAFVRGRKGGVRKDALQCLLNRVTFRARERVLESLTQEEERLRGGVEIGEDLSTLMQENISSRPGTREMDSRSGTRQRGGGEGTGFATVDFSNAFVIEEFGGGEEGGGGVGDEDEEDVSGDDVSVDSSSPLAAAPSVVDDETMGSASYASYGYSKNVVGETEAAARVNALMWKAENNATASAREFLRTDRGKEILELEKDRLRDIRERIGVGLGRGKDRITR